jgi:hypothetical protein
MDSTAGIAKMYLKVVFAPNLFVGGRPGRVEGECMGFEEEEELVSVTHAGAAKHADLLYRCM